jgi:hypothetical protein
MKAHTFLWVAFIIVVVVALLRSYHTANTTLESFAQSKSVCKRQKNKSQCRKRGCKWNDYWIFKQCVPK